MKIKLGNYTVKVEISKKHKTPILDKLWEHRNKQFWANSAMLDLQPTDEEMKEILNPFKLD